MPSSRRRSGLGLLLMLVALALALGPGSGLAAPLERLWLTSSPVALWFGRQGLILLGALCVYACALWMDHAEQRTAGRRDPR
jgi:hypothetical protein